MYQKIGIIGGGAFGYALALSISRAHPSVIVRLTDHHREYIDGLRNAGRHPFFHNNEIVPVNLTAVDSIEYCICDVDLVVFAVQAQKLRQTVQEAKPFLPYGCHILSVAKALEVGTNKRMSEVVEEEVSDYNPIAVLSGGMIASEVANGSPVGAQIATTSKNCRKNLQLLFKTTNIHVTDTIELESVEYAAAFKSVVAIGAGVCDGLGYGPSSKAFFITKFTDELEFLAEDFMKLDSLEVFRSTQSWFGDILTSCYGNTRNREFGELIGKGSSFNNALLVLSAQRRHAEGVATLQIVYKMLVEANISSPFLLSLYRVVFSGCNPREEFQQLAYQNV